MSDRKEYLKEYHAEHAQETAVYKQKQRALDDLVLFHVRRNVLYGYPLPASVAADTDRVERMRAELAARMAEPVEVVASTDSTDSED
ncbi:MAG: hypothetical protein JXR40_06885 [Pontiellaceae bacterium]|nr:hypothetical protein [Pontiellaceae bacterium]